jgi:hypothetical protein
LHDDLGQPEALDDGGQQEAERNDAGLLGQVERLERRLVAGAPLLKQQAG